MKFLLSSDPALIDPALAGRKVFVLIWTTTPWTLPSNLGIAVHPNFDYVAVESGDEVYIVAADLMEVVAAGAIFLRESCAFRAPNSTVGSAHPAGSSAVLNV